MIDILDYAVGLSRMLPGQVVPSERVNHFMFQNWHPYGIVGVVTAFNFPVAVWAWNAALAIIAGNVMLWKPSSSTPLTAISVQKICNRVARELKLPKVFNLVTGSGTTIGNLINKDERIPLVSFTGSSAIGREVGSKVAYRFGHTILECGGNNAIIISEFADLEKAAQTVLFASVGTAGQRCTTCRRVIVHKSVAEKFKQMLVELYQRVKIGDPTDGDTLMGPLINQRAVDEMFQAIQKAQEQGGEIIYGGNRREDISQLCVEPTIIFMRSQTEIVKQETFAPILYFLVYDGDIRQAIAMNNDVPQGLSSALFTENFSEAMIWVSASGSKCGIANINTSCSGAEIGVPFGGEGETGGGRESGGLSYTGYVWSQSSVLNYGRIQLAQGLNFGVKKEAA
jgi:aldehyde dehydrogenase (NAD+)